MQIVILFWLYVVSAAFRDGYVTNCGTLLSFAYTQVAADAAARACIEHMKVVSVRLRDENLTAGGSLSETVHTMCSQLTV